MLSRQSGYALHLLGLPEVSSSVASSFPNKGFVLLAALILAPGRRLTRQAAAALLWEDVGQTRALANLRQLLLRLHRARPGADPLVEVQGGVLAAARGAHSSDLFQFVENCQASDTATRIRAIHSVRGQLLQGIDTGDDQFFLWILAERARVAELFFTAAASAMHGLSRFGSAKFTDVSSVAERIIAFDPEREESYCLVMETYARCGHKEAGTRVYRALVEMLRTDQERSPTPATTAVLRRMESQATTISVRQETTVRATGRAPRVAFAVPTKSDGSAVEPLTMAFIDDVANSLSRFRSFAVLAPHSSFTVSAGQDFQATLGTPIAYVVRSVVLHDQTIAISLRAEQSSELIWASEFRLDDTQLRSIFQILSKQVAVALTERLERHHQDHSRSSNPSAYIHLLTGQNMLRQCELPILRRARREFRRAAELDPTLAAARSRIAQTLQLEWLLLGGADPYLLQRARAEAEAAIEIDAFAGMGHWMAAVIALYQRDYEGSAEKFLEAESLSPNSADLLLQHADAMAHFGEADRAWEKFGLAIELNPRAPDIYWWAGAGIAFHRHDYASAVELCARMENDEPALRVLTASHALQNNIPAARACADRLRENFPGMTAREIVKLSPDKNTAVNDEFYRGLKLAGIN